MSPALYSLAVSQIASNSNPGTQIAQLASSALNVVVAVCPADALHNEPPDLTISYFL